MLTPVQNVRFTVPLKKYYFLFDRLHILFPGDFFFASGGFSENCQRTERSQGKNIIAVRTRFGSCLSISKCVKNRSRNRNRTNLILISNLPVLLLTVFYGSAKMFSSRKQVLLNRPFISKNRLFRFSAPRFLQCD